jgi:secreted trypsin-like serine protease
LVAAALFAAVPVGSALAVDAGDYIIGGTPAEEGAWPWQVRLFESMDDQEGFCGGSLIANDWVLTAAHCVYDGDGNVEDQIVVGYGSNERSKLKRVMSAKIIPNEAYQQGDASDLALIKLSEALPDAKPVELASPKDVNAIGLPGSSAVVTGWGALWDFTSFDKASMKKSEQQRVSPGTLLNRSELDVPMRLHQVELEVTEHTACEQAYDNVGNWIADTEICGSWPSGGRGACFGDSGGPLVSAVDGGKRYVQIGIVSWGVECGNPLVPSVFARVSAFYPWIQEQMKANN